MKKQITLFPMIDEDLLKDMQCDISIPNALYEYNGEKKKLELEDLNSNNREFSVSDKLGSWEIKEYNLILKGSIDIKDVSILFGDEGVTTSQSKLALGIVWKSKATDMRGAEKIVTISSKDKRIYENYSHTFGKSTIREGVEVSIVIYLEEYLGAESEFCAQVPGTILGEIAHYKFILEGNGSQFTVVEKYTPRAPLWNVECEWDDPTCDQFGDTVRIVLNTAHPAWELLENPKVKKEMLKEIMASSMQIIIGNLEEDEYDLDEDYERGSVSEAIAYFMNVAKIDSSSPQDVAKSIRKFLDGAMK